MTEQSGKWVLKKTTNPAWAEHHPWTLSYPGGGGCYCLSFVSAVAQIDRTQRNLRWQRQHLKYEQLRFLAGHARQALLSEAS